MNYRGFQTSPDGIKVEHKIIVPGTDELLPRPLALFVNAGGDVTMVDENGTEIVWHVVSGQFIPFSPVKITALGDGVEIIGLN